MKFLFILHFTGLKVQETNSTTEDVETKILNLQFKMIDLVEEFQMMIRIHNGLK